jgi:dUTP pyrophosphatase
MTQTLKLQILDHAKGLDLPNYQTAQAAGLDLTAAVPEHKPLLVMPNEWLLVPTGLILEIPNGYEGQVRPRSGLALKHGITVLNSPGTIDSDYRGEVKVMLMNFGDESFTITRGMRIAQMVIAPVIQVQIMQVETLSQTSRGTDGFGSTGTS